MSSQTLTQPEFSSAERPPALPQAPVNGAPGIQAGVPGGSASAMSRADRDEPFSEFDYRPVPVVAPVALFLGLCSVIGLFGLIGLGVGAAGVVLGAVATLRIRRSRGELSGQWLAVTGLVLSAVFLASAGTLHAYTIATEVPEGFTRVNFTRDISKKGFTVVEGETTIDPEVRKLDGERIFLKGYMYPERQQQGLTEFVLVKDNQQCCFGGQPQLFDMITVQMDPGQAVEFTQSLVSVAGVFRALAPQQSGSLNTVYRIDASYFSHAKTSF